MMGPIDLGNNYAGATVQDEIVRMMTSLWEVDLVRVPVRMLLLESNHFSQEKFQDPSSYESYHEAMLKTSCGQQLTY